MGSPSACYQEILRGYIQMNCRWSKYEKEFTDEYLLTLSEEELEKLSKRFNQLHDKYACFMMGAATANFLNECCNDEANACAAAIGDLYNLLKIDEPDDVDFVPIAKWNIEERPIRIDGMWDDAEYSTIHDISCSRCKKRSPGQGYYKYCPRCGAEMENGI